MFENVDTHIWTTEADLTYKLITEPKDSGELKKDNKQCLSDTPTVMINKENYYQEYKTCRWTGQLA